MTHKQHHELADKIIEAQKNKSMLWQGVVSFNPDFLERAKLYDPETGVVNQRAIKRAVQKAIPEMLKQEELNVPETFWWADVHLNTNHVHVHIGISQTKNTRPLKFGEPKGRFQTKSLKKIKSIVHREVEDKVSRKQDINLEKKIDELKKDVVDQLKENLQQQHQQKILEQIWHALPKYKDKRRWRASNNSYDFREAKLLTGKLVDDFLKTDLNQDYEEYLSAIKQKDSDNREKYGQNIPDSIPKNQKDLHDYLMNRVFDELRKVDIVSTKSNFSERVKWLGIEGNNELIEVLSKQLKNTKSDITAKKLKKEIGIRKYYVGVLIKENKNKNYLDQISELKEKGLKNNVQDYLINDLQEKYRLGVLQLIPRNKRDNDNKTEYQKLVNKHADVIQLSIKKINEEIVAQKNQYLDEWLKVVKNTKDPNVQIYLKNQGLENVNLSEYVDLQKRIMQAKLAIKDNNQQYANNVSLRNQKNGKLFKQLKKDYEQLKNINSKIDLNQTQMRLNQASNDKHVSRQKNKSKSLSKKENAERKSKNSVSPRLLGKLSSALTSVKKEGQERINALRRNLDKEDDFEKQDRIDEIETETGRSMER
ncbi:relaxase MobL [Ligilactobacillus salivarius]|uniref:relaxase MobL n=1 Tax=Ligilactobacillus salivarius TaxID=1624 RepID=UPI001F4CC105|nr:relaxase MobL [Ligilactobacillus salivarius]